ncbi:MAG: tyrosine recombinase XerC [Balneolaceae bacterium]|nr:MAG: tyrosine recombinase XerC [Balneolaceae bacterium]
MTELISKFILTLRTERNASEHTLTSYKNDLLQLLEFAADEFVKKPEAVSAGDIDRLTIRLWLGSLADKGVARNTVARKVAAVRSFYKYCFKRGYVEQNPAQLLIVPKKEIRLPKTLQLSEVSNMMDLADGSEPESVQERTIMELFYSTGIRLSELTGLNISDVDLRQKQVTVFGKGKKQRTVPLGDEALQWCKKHLESRMQLLTEKSDNDARLAFFIAPRGGRMYQRKVQRIIKDYLMRASESSNKSPHTLRHSFATHMLDAGADIRLIKEFLGHASLASTQVYTHTSVERLKNVYNQAHPRAEK